jgi:gliding motility-associated-like protein
LWNTGAIGSSIVISQPGSYWLQVIDNNQCSGSDTILLLPKECIKGFYIPTAFTPDDDGLNDIFKPIIGGVVKEYLFTIYNRWGQVVFQSSNPGQGWNGMFGGILQDGNVFTWLCRYQLAGEPAKLEKGTVLLIR